MFNNRVVVHAGRCTARATRRKVSSSTITTKRNLAHVAPAPASSASSKSHKVVVIGGGSAGVAVSHQLLRTGKFAPRDIAVVDPATWHHFQPGWTLVGGGLKNKQDLRRPMKDLFDPKLDFYHDSVKGFSPTENFITLSNGDKVGYEQLVVAPGIKIDYASIKGLPEALEDRSSSVSTIYGYDSCDKAFETIQRLKKGNAIFTQPAGVIKCAGAPQKIMWLAVDFWKRAGLYDPGNVVNSPIQVTFATGLPVMFGVPKYSAKLNEMREERAVEGLFKHDLKSIDGDHATFAHVETGEQVTRKFDLLHAVPKMGPHDFVKTSGLTNEAGYVDVDEATLQQKKYHNVWSCGDASSLPTSKTLAAITSQVPVLVKNLTDTMEGKKHDQTYDGYTSCPLLTEYGKVMLAEFKYGGEPKETFGNLMGIDQATPRRAFYHLKKDFFPWIYQKAHVKGTWHGPKGWRP